MRRTKTMLMGDLLEEFFKRPYVAAKVAEGKLPDTWREIVGDRAAEITTELKIENHILYARIQSSVLRSELFYQREALKEEINRRSGVRLVNAVIIKRCRTILHLFLFYFGGSPQPRSRLLDDRGTVGGLNLLERIGRVALALVIQLLGVDALRYEEVEYPLGTVLGDALVSGLGSRLLVGMAHDLVNHVLRAVLDLLGHQLEAGLLLRGQPRHAVIEEDDRSIGCNLLLGGNDGSGRGGSSCRSCGIGRGGELGLRGGKLLCQLGILDLHGGGSGHAGGYGVLESLDVRNGIARNTALPAALVKAVGETCRSAEAEQVGAVHRNGADPRRRYQPFEFDIEIERRNLLSQPKVNANDWCVPEPLFSWLLSVKFEAIYPKPANGTA